MALQFLFLEKQRRHNSRHVMLWKMEPTSAINNIYKYRGKNQLSNLICQIMFGLICNYQSKYIKLISISIVTMRPCILVFQIQFEYWKIITSEFWVSRLRQQSDNHDFFVCFPFEHIDSMTLTSFKPFLLRVVTYGFEQKIS